MESMETFIVVIALIASAAGTLLLLACLAGKRSQLVKAYNFRMEAGTREQDNKDNTKKMIKRPRQKPFPK